MKNSVRYSVICLALFCLVGLAGCKKEKVSSSTIPEATQNVTSLLEETTLPQVTIEQEQPTTITFNYAPGWMGIHVKAEATIEVPSDVMDNITMTLSDKKATLIRQRVSDYQFDFIKDGHQIGGFILLDIPREMLENPPKSWAEFEEIGDLVFKQTMADIYPSGAYIAGGGHFEYGWELQPYMLIVAQDTNGNTYCHYIFKGEKYIYDFWIDEGWMADGGETIMTTLSAKEIKPELNQSELWTVHDFEDFPGVPKR